MWKNRYFGTRKAQASLIDVVILGTAISFVLIAGTYLHSQQEIAAQNNKFYSMYSQAMLNNIMMFRTDFASPSGLIRNASIAQLIVLHFCDNSLVDGNSLASFINNSIIRYEAPKGYNYIFYTTNGAKELIAYNKQARVCGTHIPLAVSDITINCPATTSAMNIKYYFGMWPEWKKYPEVC